MAARKAKDEGTNRLQGEPNRYVWRFVDYKGRFGAEEALKQFKAQCVPKYIQWHINAWDGYGGAAVLALNRLRAEKEFIWLQGAVVELLTVATNTHPEYQGYLLTSRHEPATASNVGSMLRVDGRKALAVLTRLENVGFLEQVPWPPSDSDGPIPDDPRLRLLRDVAAASKKPAGKGGGKGRFCPENTDAPLQKRRSSEMLAAQAKVEGTAAETPPGEGGQVAQTLEMVKLVCPKCGHKGQAPKTGAKQGQCTQCGTVVPNLQTSTSTTSTTSTNPDAGVGREPGTVQAFRPKAHPPSIVRLQEVREEITPRKYSPAGNEFGEQICAAYGFVAREGGDYVSEVAHFAKIYDEYFVTLSDLSQAKVRQKVLRIAAEIRTGKKHPECPGAYMQRVMQNAIRDQKRLKKDRIG